MPNPPTGSTGSVSVSIYTSKLLLETLKLHLKWILVGGLLLAICISSSICFLCLFGVTAEHCQKGNWCGRAEESASEIVKLICRVFSLFDL